MREIQGMWGGFPLAPLGCEEGESYDKRISSIETFRVLAMFGVILVHTNWFGLAPGGRRR
jgi:hypothetical protein